MLALAFAVLLGVSVPLSPLGSLALLASAGASAAVAGAAVATTIPHGARTPPDLATELTAMQLGTHGHCEPSAITPCRATEITCRVEGLADPNTAFWVFDDGGPEASGARIRRTLPPGLTSYSLRLRAGPGDAPSSGPVTLPLDWRVAEACPEGTVQGGGTDAPPPRPTEGLRVVVLADSNGPYGTVPQPEGVTTAVIAVRDEVRPDIVVHVGDMVAGQSSAVDAAALTRMWAAYGEAVREPLDWADIPLVPVPGNHDASPSGKLADRDVYVATWKQPDWKPEVDFVDGTNYPLEYAFRHRGALFVVLDAPTGQLTGASIAWLRKVLADFPDAHPRYVFAHVPPLQPTDRAYGKLRGWDSLASVLREGAVDQLVTGHYEVFYPTRLDGVEVVVSPPLATPCRWDDAKSGCRCRTLRGWPLCLGKGLLVLDSVGGRVTTRFALQGPEFGSVLPAATLPARVGGHTRSTAWR